jgi:hypothetical protein
MNRKHPASLLLALAVASSTGIAYAQTANPSASPSREQVRMETKEFLKTHRWDEATDAWMLKKGFEPPAGVVSRDIVKAQRDEFLRKNHWDEQTSTWVPRNPEPKSTSGLARAQLRADTIAFKRTHHWHEEEGRWDTNPATTAKKP